MDIQERIKRNVALKLFTEPKNNTSNILDMCMGSKHYLNTHSQLPSWEVVMKGWVQISKLRRDNPRAGECEDGAILIDRAEMTVHSVFISAMQVRNGSWYSGKEGKWGGCTWSSYNAFVENEPNQSNSNSLLEAVWKGVTDLAILWCEFNVNKFEELEYVV